MRRCRSVSAELAVAAALALLVAAGLLALARTRWARLTCTVGDLAVEVRRREAHRAEAELLRTRRAPVVNATSSVAVAVGRGARWTRLGHDAVALAPFAILSAIPRTRRRTEQVKVIHDSISTRVYDAIEAATDQLSQ